MNKKVLKTMIALVVIFLVALYVLKIFFPQEFVMAIENEVIINMGNYIDSHEWAYYLSLYITSFITYWLYCCAVCRRWRLKWYECIYILLAITVVRVLTMLNYNLSTIISVLTFVILPSLMGGKLKDCAFVYTIHGVAQGLSLSIRDLPMYFTNVNTLIATFMILECYFWLILMYLYGNYKEGEKENERM